jgi:hypothetical protein
MKNLRTRITVLAASAALATAGLGALAGPASAHTPSCGNNSLAVTNVPSEGATGHGSFVILFRNKSGSTCTIFGYPGLDALNASGHALAHATRTLHGFAGGAHSEATITVKPGNYASATVEWLNFNPKTSGACTFSKKVATTPANTGHTVDLPVSVSVCTLQVHPTVGGASGNTEFAYAQLDWQRGASVSSALQGKYWTAAKNKLKVESSRYAPQISELTKLIALPDANQTAAQNHAFRTYVAELDSFFALPGLYT